MPGRRASVPHRQRPPHVAAHPVHVTLRSVEAVRCLRAARVFPLVRGALVASSRADFDEFSEASQGRDRDRSVLVCRMVRRVARAARRERDRATARGFGTPALRHSCRRTVRSIATINSDDLGDAGRHVRFTPRSSPRARPTADRPRHSPGTCSARGGTRALPVLAARCGRSGGGGRGATARCVSSRRGS